MLGAGITLSAAFQAAFKEVYKPDGEAFKKQQNLSCKFWKELKVGAEKPSNRGVIGVATMSGNEAGRAVNEDETFQAAGDLNPQRPTIHAREYVHPFSFSGRSIELSQSSKQAFAQITSAGMSDSMARACSSLNRQALGTGTGQMSLVNGAVVVSRDVIVDNILPFRRGMIIDVWTAIGGAKQVDARTIRNIDLATLTITLDQDVSCDDDSIIVMSGVLDGAPPDGKELTGIQKMIDTNVFGNDYEGLSSVTNPEWRGNVIDGNGNPISQTLMQQTADRIALIGEGSPDLMVSNRGIRRDFLDTEVQKTRYEGQNIDSGFNKLKWNEFDWVVEKDCELGEMYFIDRNEAKRYETRDLHVGDHDNNQVLRVASRNAISGFFEYVGNIGTIKRNAHGKLTNLQDPYKVAGNL